MNLTTSDLRNTIIKLEKPVLSFRGIQPAINRHSIRKYQKNRTRVVYK